MSSAPANINRHYWLGTALVAGAAALLGGLVFGVSTFLLRPQYRATARFSPEGGSGSRLPASLSELASQFSLDLGSQGTKPLQYYSVVLRSDAVLDQVLDAKMNVPGYPPTVASFLETQINYSDSLPRQRVRKWLRDRTTVSIDFRATTMELSVTLPDRRAAAATTNLFIDALNDFNTSKRASQARARRMYLETVLALQHDSLQQAEDSLQRFLERNRQYKESPALDFQQTRLRRRADLNLQVVSSLQRDLEAARLDEINATPVISVIDSAVPPITRASPRRLRTALFGAVLGAAAAVYLIVVAVGAPTRNGLSRWAADTALRWDGQARGLIKRVSPKSRRT